MADGKRKSMKCDSFIFYASFFEAIKELPDENQLALYNAIFEYGLNGVEPKLKGIEKTVFTLIAPQLKANRVRYENGCLGGKYGARGGAPKGNQNARKQPQNNPTPKQTEEKNNRETTPNQPQNNPKTTPNENENENENENDSLLIIKSLKDKFRRAGVYTGAFDEVIDEVLTVLGEATLLPRPLKFSGVTYTGEDFRRIADTLTVEDLCRIVNTLIGHKDEIEDARYYILGVIANIAGERR